MADEPKVGPNRGNAGKGRPKGAANKFNREVKDMILEALDGVGGVKYLMERASDPKTAAAFLTLVGKVMPTQLNMADADGEKLSLSVVFVKPNAASAGSDT